MKEEFKVGDVVQLNSGGPAMTVSNITEGMGRIGVTWMNEGELRYASINSDSLKRKNIVERSEVSKREDEFYR